jgi:hypothetical protein
VGSVADRGRTGGTDSVLAAHEHHPQDARMTNPTPTGALSIAAGGIR